MKAVARDDRDTDPAPRGNGHGDSPPDRYPCAVHAAELVETRRELREMRELMTQMRDAQRLQSARLESEIEASAKFRDDVGFALVEQGQRLDVLIRTIGEPPDPTTGQPGTGMRGQWVATLNAAVKGAARAESPSLLDEESEVTGVLDREALVVTKRRAERGNRRLWIAVIGLATTLITTIGAVLMAWLGG